MNPSKVSRDRLVHLTDLPNVGKACARDLERLGVHKPTDLVGRDPHAMYERLCLLTGTRQDPCVLDTLVSVVRFMQGDDARPWWHYSAERKRASAPTQCP
ncbi:helix-hairpin-helix domain-containing protein [Hydrogenophaga sp. MI9]|uniref:helix-hairpin-helix domain-containing protein n=1 Tax=Hydrogenophaga sp. MI9 TaxID=3453719 RepID=UPI003EEE635D